MEKQEIYIESYFPRNKYVARTAYEAGRIKSIQQTINSYDDEADAAKWIYDRRLSNFNRDEDFKLFGIPRDAEISEHYTHKQNKYFKEAFKQKREKEERNFSALRNLKYRLASTKVGRAVTFIQRHLHAFLWSLLAVVILTTVLLIVVFISGVVNSFGHSPFVLCTESQIRGESPVVSEETVNEATSREYIVNAFIMKAKEYGWRDEAIVGVVAYILQEGSGFGSFTYEGFWFHPGPSGTNYDKTLDNKAWLDWMDGYYMEPVGKQVVGLHILGNGEKDAHKTYKAKGNSHYAAIGLGLFQSSNVWRYQEPTEEDPNEEYLWVANADELISYCEERGKPWQDPETQLDYYFTTILNDHSAFNYDNVDPRTSKLSAEEWCKRITAGVGCGNGFRWNSPGSYSSTLTDHTQHLASANKFLKKFTGVELFSLNSAGFNLCETTNHIVTGGNASIADAAVTLAATDEVKIRFDIHGINSPNLQDPRLYIYKTVKTAIFTDDPTYYASCDRATATAVRWSGSDDDFPCEGTSKIYNYLKSSEKWEYIGIYGKCELLPGDVLSTIGHVKIYVGNAAVQTKFPGSESDMYEASLEDYFPRVFKDYSYKDKRVYSVFRCVKPDKSSRYSKIDLGGAQNE